MLVSLFLFKELCGCNVFTTPQHIVSDMKTNVCYNEQFMHTFIERIEKFIDPLIVISYTFGYCHHQTNLVET